MTDNAAFQTQDCGSRISLHSLYCSVTLPSTLCTKGKQIRILHGVSGVMGPGFNAIMGPSGCGKTTLLNVMAGRADATHVDGEVLVDGKQQPKNFKCISGFVTQDDILMETLTVRENLMFSAKMRLPECIPEKEKERKVNELLYELALLSCADSRVGSEVTRGISGGERKRTSIGMELIISPKVLFLDEPTTGLDSSTANAVMHLLKTLSQTGRTIICSIHQPCYNIFKLFDSLLLLSSGRLIYHGPSASTLNYFNRIGYECEEHNNPADFFLDVANGDIKTLADLQEPDMERTIDKIVLSEDLKMEFLNSPFFQRLKINLDTIQSESRRTLGGIEKFKFSTSFTNQFHHLSKRAIKNLARNPGALLLNTVKMTILGLFIGLIFSRQDNNVDNVIQNKTGLLFFLVTSQVFINVSLLSLFISERLLIKQESSSGFYRVSAYFFSKVIFEVLPIRLVPLILFCSTCYFSAGLQPKAGKFFFCLLTVAQAGISAASITLALSTSSSSTSTAHLKFIYVFVTMELFGGFLRNLLTIPAWLSWLQYLSIFRYALKSLYINELKDLKIYTNGTEIADFGRKYLRAQGINHDTTWDLWQNNLALLVITVIFSILTFIKLFLKYRLK